MPKLNLPEKSHEPKEVVERKHRNIVKDDQQLKFDQKSPLYKSFEEFVNRVRKLKLSSSGWCTEEFPNKVTFKLFEEQFVLPKFEIQVNQSLTYTCAVYGWVLPVDHQCTKHISDPSET